MSDEPVTDARDVIARDMHMACLIAWKGYDKSWHGPEFHHPQADSAVAALAAAGLTITETPGEWQYGVRDIATGTVLFDEAETEEDTRGLAKMDAGFTLIRRGVWEVAP